MRPSCTTKTRRGGLRRILSRFAKPQSGQSNGWFSAARMILRLEGVVDLRAACQGAYNKHLGAVDLSRIRVSARGGPT